MVEGNTELLTMPSGMLSHTTLEPFGWGEPALIYQPLEPRPHILIPVPIGSVGLVHKLAIHDNLNRVVGVTISPFEPLSADEYDAPNLCIAHTT